MTLRTMKTAFLSFVAVGVSLVATAGHFYVDAVNGNDAWNGLAETKGEEVTAGVTNGPRKTLMGIVQVANNSVAVIHAAPGHYNEGSYEGKNDMSNYYARVYLGAGQTLIATKGPEVTFIEGASDTTETQISPYGHGPKAMRCVTLNASSKVIGFTITGGRMRYLSDGGPTMSARGGGVIFLGNGYVEGCIISNNAAVRGGAAYNVSSQSWGNSVLMNCRVYNNRALNPGMGTMYCTQINCLFKDNVNGNYAINSGRALNCTIFDSVCGSIVSNSYIAAGADRGSNQFGGCYYVTGYKQDTSTYTGCTPNSASAYTFAADGMTPGADSPLVDAVADTSFYDATWPTDAKLAAYKNMDAVGGPRIVDGKMDVGAVEYDWVRTPPKGLAVETETEGESTTVKFTRTFPSKDAVVQTLTFAGETVDFSDRDDDWVFTKSVTGDVYQYTLTVTYAKDVWYVNADPAKGSDGNDGFCKSRPFKTLAKAMSKVAGAGGVVHAAPGVYNEGEMKDYSYFTTNRVVVKAYVTLVGDAGAEQTVIEGKWATVNPNNGCGNDAIRCALLKEGAVLRGFTLRNGATYYASEYGEMGGGVFGQTGDNSSTAVDCIITNCRAVRGGGSTYGQYVRCVFRSNGSANASYPKLSAYYGNYYGCYFDEDPDACGVYVPGGTSKFVNCTIRTRMTAGTSSAVSVYNSYVHGESGGIAFYRSATYVTSETSTYNDGTVKYVAASKVETDANYRPVFTATALRDKGNDAYLDLYPEKWRDTTDLAGGARVLNGAVDIGAGEYTWVGQTGIGFTYAAVDAGGGCSNLTITPVHDSPLPLTGFTFNGKDYDVVGLTPITTDNPVLGDPLQALVVRYASEVTEWYVSPTGNDNNLGYASDVPFKTFSKAMAKAQSGHVVHALPGTYDYGLMDVVRGTTNRVVVKAGVGLVADEGPEKTVIVGRRSSDPGDHGVGSDAVRCVALMNDAYVRGFTLTGGATARQAPPNHPYSHNGGGVVSDNLNMGAAVDCIITNNTAVRGGGSYNATCIRCFFKDNTTDAWSTGNGGYEGSYIDCAFAEGSDVNTSYLVLNCSVYGSSSDSNLGQIHGITKSAAAQTINTVCKSAYGNSRYYSNCVFRTNCSGASDKTMFDSSCKFSQPEADEHDENYRPVSNVNSVLVDKGWIDAYNAHFPAKWVQFKTDRDAFGGQRVYNAAIDIGSGEYDWRPTYTARLVGKRGEVVEASPNVVEGTEGVDLPNGESLAIDWTAPRTGKQSFSATVTGEGTLTVLCDGEPIAAKDGVYTFHADAGSVSRIDISFEGTGTAEVLKFRSAPRGMVIIVK